jgi:5-methylcytosine-specific restriction endonuclease McrA
MKRCTKCKVEQPAAEFSKSKRSKDGLQPWCRSCYRARWYADPERNRRNAASYRALHAERLRKQKLAYAAANREREAARAREWSRRNPERKRQSADRWAKENPQKHREMRRMIEHRRQARQLGLPSFAVAPRDMRRLLAGPCAVAGCGNVDIQIDHIVPVARGGSSGIGNYQPLCRHHNTSKGSKTWMEFRIHLALKASAAA